MAKGKKNRKNADEQSDVGSDEEVAVVEETKSATGGKTKKDRKKKKEAELEDAQQEMENLNDGDQVSDEDEDKSKKESKKKKKQKAKEVDEDEGAVEAPSKGKKGKKKKTSGDSDEDEELVVKKSGFALLMEDEGDDGEESAEEVAPQPVKKSNNKKKKPTFQQLAASTMSDEEDQSGVDDDDHDVVEVEKVVTKKTKKSKKSAPVDNDDEDLDKALAELGIEPSNTGDKGKKDKKKKKKKKAEDEDEDDLDKALAELRLEGGIEASDLPAAAEADEQKKKKKEKKERQKQKEKEAPTDQPAAVTAQTAAAVTATSEEASAVPAEDEDGKGKKGKKKGAAAAEKEDKKGKKPGKGMLAAMQEALKKVQEEEERRRREEEEKLQRELEAERERLEQKRLAEERKALKKQREKEKKEQLRKEGKLLTAKQKEAKARAEAMLAAMRAQGIQVPEAGEKRGPRPGTRIRPNKWKHGEQEDSAAKGDAGSKESSPSEGVDDKSEKADGELHEEVKESWEHEEEDIKESWEEVAEEDTKEVEKPTSAATKAAPVSKSISKPAAKAEAPEESSDEDESEDEDESDSEEDESEDDSSSSEDESEHGGEVNKREKALDRINKRRALNEKNRNPNVLRAPVVCVLGHVDTGKTKILDKLRRTNVQDNEAGGITQQIGATNVPIEVIKEQCKMVKNFDGEDMKLPGLLIIDTPGHESFSNLRDRGSSLCDIAILVVDIMHCLEPQTIESINMLKKKKVPFIIALNKIDRIYEWKSNRHKDVSEVVKSQAQNTFLEFEKRAKEVIIAMAEQGLNAALFYENPDPKTFISMVPTSAHTGEGMGNLMALLVKLSQDMLAKRLAFSEEMQATVLEVKAIPGLGTTIDIVLLNGTLREGQTMIIAGTDGPIVTQVKALLTPAKMQDLRVKNTYIEHKEIRGSQGVKIAAKDLEKAIAGLNVLVAYHPDEVELCKEEIQARLDSVLNAIKVKDRGVFVQASTLGSLEALLEFLKTSKIPFAGVKVGPVVKRDVMKASVMLEHEAKYAVILAFDVKVERDAQDMADTLGVKIFQADIIYHLFDRFTAYQDDLRRQKREEFKHVVVFPCKLRVLPQCVFKSRDPIVVGVIVEAGVVRTGTPICVPSKEFLDIGIVSSLQVNHKEVETARKGEEVCVKIDPIPGESPKMFGRHFDETDLLVSKISRASIDACKEYFRDDLQKSDWQLMIELKKTFGIM